MKVRCVLTFIVLLAAAGLTAAQTKPPEEEIRVDTDIVEVPLVVTDRTGKPVAGLKRDNFIIFEDEKLQTVSSFSSVSAPFEVVLVLDTSGSTLAELPLIRSAAERFIGSLRPGDRVSIVSYRAVREAGKSNAVSEIVSPLTDDRTSLVRSLEHVQTSYGTPFYDSLVEVSAKIFDHPPGEQFRGRRAIVALTDGVDSTSNSDFESSMEKVSRTGAAVYFIKVDTRDYFEENLLGDCTVSKRFSQSQIRKYYQSLGSGKVEKVSNFCDLGDFERLAISKRLYELADGEMDRLSRVSGGKVLPIDDLSGAVAAFKKVADEIGTRYSLGYYPSNEKHDGTYRKIRVQLRGLPQGSEVRAREGYTAPAN